jgi:hypothetical protein
MQKGMVVFPEMEKTFTASLPEALFCEYSTSRWVVALIGATCKAGVLKIESL